MTLNSTTRTLLALTTALGLSSSIAIEGNSKGAVSSSSASDSACRSCLSQAASLFASNDLDKAAEILRKNSPACPRSAQLHLLFSTILIRQGKEQKAEAEKEAALACVAQPDSQAAHLQYANTLLLFEKYAQSAREFETVASLNPASYEAWSALADLYKRLRQDDNAKSAADKAAVLEPGTQAIKLSILQNLKRQGRLSQAKKELKKLMQGAEVVPEFEQSLANEAILLGAFDEAIEASQHVIKAYPDSIGPQRCLFLAQFMKRQYQPAVASADKILTAKSKNVDILALRGLCNWQLGKIAEGETDIQNAQSTNTSSSFVLLADGLLKLHKGNFEEAAEVLNSVTGSDTKGLLGDKIPQSLAHIALSNLHRKEGLLTEAIQEAHAAGVDKRFQSAALALESRAILNDTARADALQAASKLASDALTIDPDEPNAILAQAFCELRAGKFDEAKKSAAKRASLAVADSDLGLLLALLAEHDSNASLQKQELEKGLKLSDNDPELLFELGRMYLKENKAAEAVPFLKQAVERRVRGPEICFALAEACEKSGDAGASLKYYKQSLSQGLSGDNSKQAKEAITRLESK